MNFLVEGFYTRLSDVFVLENIGERDGILIKERRNGSGAKVLGLSMEGKMAYLSLFQLQAGVTLQQSRYDEPESGRNGTGRERRFSVHRIPMGTLRQRIRRSSLSHYPCRARTPARCWWSTWPVILTRCGGEYTRFLSDMGVKVAYDFKLYKSVDLQLSAGVQNVFNAYQNDFDQGVERGSDIYGPGCSAKLFRRNKDQLLTPLHLNGNRSAVRSK